MKVLQWQTQLYVGIGTNSEIQSAAFYPATTPYPYKSHLETTHIFLFFLFSKHTDAYKFT